MKIFFVGMHDKPNMKPLDSKTKTGKIIDLIISELPDYECVKTNLCKCEYLPTNKLEIKKYFDLWINIHKPKENDVIVLLGRFVQSNFHYNDGNLFFLAHPSSLFGFEKRDEYVFYAALDIKEFFINCQ